MNTVEISEDWEHTTGFRDRAHVAAFRNHLTQPWSVTHPWFVTINTRDTSRVFAVPYRSYAELIRVAVSRMPLRLVEEILEGTDAENPPVVPG